MKRFPFSLTPPLIQSLNYTHLLLPLRLTYSPFFLPWLRSYTYLRFSKFITFFLSNIMMMTVAASVSCLSLSGTRHCKILYSIMGFIISFSLCLQILKFGIMDFALFLLDYLIISVLFLLADSELAHLFLNHHWKHQKGWLWQCQCCYFTHIPICQILIGFSFSGYKLQAWISPSVHHWMVLTFYPFCHLIYLSLELNIYQWMICNLGLHRSQRSRECSICWQLFVLKDPARTIYLLASSGSLGQTLIPVTKICGLYAKRLLL